MTLDDIITEVTARLGAPTNAFTGREVGIATVDGWVWTKDRAPYGLRIERVGDRHVVRAWRHTLPDGRRAELLRTGALTADEIRAVAVLGGLLLNAQEEAEKRHLLATDPWGWSIEHPAGCLPDLAACKVHAVAAANLTRGQCRGILQRHEVEVNDFGDRLYILDVYDNGLNDPERCTGGTWPVHQGEHRVAAGGGQS